MLRAKLRPMVESRKKRLTEDLQFLLESLEQEGDDNGKLHHSKESARRGT
jgi:hypothetical protein